MLRVSKVPPGDPSTEDYVGQNRFECLTCPYQFVINKRYYERKYMKKKEVEDILGGKGAWDNVDKTEGMVIAGWEITRGRWLTREQCNVRMRSVVMTRRIGINCRFGVLMSL